MKSNLRLVLLLVCLLAGCIPNATVTTPPETAVTSSPIPPTNTPEPALTPPPQEVTFYRLRVEYATTSDWSTLELLTPENVLAVRMIEARGEPVNSQAGIQQMSLNQPLAKSEAGKRVGMVVDYALAAESLDQTLEFILRKGNLGGSTIEISNVTGGIKESIASIQHDQIVENSDGANPKNFSVDLSPLKGSAPESAQARTASLPKLLLAFYYPWFFMNDWSSSWLQDRPLEPYASSDQQAIGRHIQQAQGAGIDGFISSWWGPGGDTDHNLVKLLDEAESRDFKAAIYFETLAGNNGAPLDETSIGEWLAYAIREYRDHPAYIKVDGKPVIVVWASGAVPLDSWERIFASLRTKGLDAVYLAMGYNPGSLGVFDGLHDYGVFLDPDLAQTDLSTARAVRYYSLLTEEYTPKIWAATVQPGYDDTLQPTREGLVRDREGGNFYRYTFESAIASNPDWIFITSWNEWWEHTHIEPGELYGDLYLQITREYADKWK